MTQGSDQKLPRGTGGTGGNGEVGYIVMRTRECAELSRKIKHEGTHTRA